jgi:hypothetical protein
MKETFMMLCRTRNRRFVWCGVLPVCVVVLAGSCIYGLARGAEAGAPKSSGPNERLRELLTQRYEILQHAVKSAELMVKAGRMDIPTLLDLTSAMYRAEADLSATDTGRVGVYEKLVDALTAQEELLERQARAGRASEVRADQGKVTVLNARIDLERLRLGQMPARP